MARRLVRGRCLGRPGHTRMLDFGQFDFGQFDFGQLAEIELAEVEIGRSRNWPKSKLLGRSRTNGVCSVSSFSPSCFCFCSVFLLFFTFFLFLLISLSLFCFCFRPQKPEQNPKPRTLHPISDGPFRWTPSNEPPSAGQTLRRTTLRRTTLRRTALPLDRPSPGPPKISLFFFTSSRHNLHSSFSLLGSFR